MSQQSKGGGGKQAPGGVQPRACQGVQARDKDGPPAAGSQGVCQCAQGGLRHVQGVAKEDYHPSNPKLVHSS